MDGGAGYTYFNPQPGHELSAVAGLTYNYINPDFRLDWGMSQFLSKQVLIGAVGYVYNQVTGDSGSGAHVGPFESAWSVFDLTAAPNSTAEREAADDDVHEVTSLPHSGFPQPQIRYPNQHTLLLCINFFPAASPERVRSAVSRTS